jgi:hypothetical protein
MRSALSAARRAKNRRDRRWHRNVSRRDGAVVDGMMVTKVYAFNG